jgi:UDP-N-acetylmuramate--alanine ligase
VVFQPHTYSRTKAFFQGFADALTLADHVILADIYSAAREKDPGDIHSRDLAKAVAERGTDALYLPSFGEIETYLSEKCCPQDLCITMGAGDVACIGEDLLRK